MVLLKTCLYPTFTFSAESGPLGLLKKANWWKFILETLQEARRARYYQPWLLLNDHHFQKLDIVINKNSNLVKFNNQVFTNSKNLRHKKIIASINSDFFLSNIWTTSQKGTGIVKLTGQLFWYFEYKMWWKLDMWDSGTSIPLAQQLFQKNYNNL